MTLVCRELWKSAFFEICFRKTSADQGDIPKIDRPSTIMFATSVLNRVWNARTLLPQATYALYFDLVKSDPDRLSVTARGAVRSAFFFTHGDNQIVSLTLDSWLSLIPRETPIPWDVKLPLDLGNEGVGSSAYFHALAAICATAQPGRIVEFGTYLGMGTASMAVNCAAEIITIDLSDEVGPDDMTGLNAADVNLVDQSRRRTGRSTRGRLLRVE